MNQFEEREHAGEPLSKFEQELTCAMRQVAPPDGFAERVMARVQESDPVSGRVLMMKLRPQVWIRGTIAAALLVGIFFAEEAHIRHQREEAELAQKQFEVAMRITDRTLQHARQQLWDAGIRLGDQ